MSGDDSTHAISSFDLDDLPTTPGLRPGGVVLGRFKLERCLGRGGMGEVWHAHDQSLEEAVALKLLPRLLQHDEHSVEELKNETKRGRQLAHPNIVRVFDYYQDSNDAAIAMEYVEGENLRALQSKEINGVFAVENIRPWVGQLLEGLAYAHKSGVVHRDLKPANLLIGNTTQALKIVDFGIARCIEDTVKMLTQAVSSRGTPCYMSPEQALGHSAHPMDDMYSLGATLYHLLGGVPPFYTGDVTTQILHKAPPTLAEAQRVRGIKQPVPAEWEETILQCLAKKRAERPQSLLEVMERLGFRGNTEPVGAPPVGKKGFNVFTSAEVKTQHSSTRPDGQTKVAKSLPSWLWPVAAGLMLFGGWWALKPEARPVSPSVVSILPEKEVPSLPVASAAAAEAKAIELARSFAAQGYKLSQLYVSSAPESQTSSGIDVAVGHNTDVVVVAAGDGLEGAILSELFDESGKPIAKSLNEPLVYTVLKQGVYSVRSTVPELPQRGFFALHLGLRQNEAPVQVVMPKAAESPSREAIALAAAKKQSLPFQSAGYTMSPLLTVAANQAQGMAEFYIGGGSQVAIITGCSDEAKGLKITVWDDRGRFVQEASDDAVSFVALRNGEYKVGVTPPASLADSNAVIVVMMGTRL